MSGGAPIRVVLAEDNDIFRESLELLFGLRDDVVVVASVSDGSDAVAACRGENPDVLLMDYRLPGLDGLRLSSAMRRSCPGVALVCLSASVEPQQAAALLAAGAIELLTKDQPLDEIVAGIHRAAGRVAA